MPSCGVPRDLHEWLMRVLPVQALTSGSAGSWAEQQCTLAAAKARMAICDVIKPCHQHIPRQHRARTAASCTHLLQLLEQGTV